MKLTRRLQKIKERLFNEDFKDKGTWYLKGDTILTNSEIREEPLIVRKAKAIEYIAENLPAFIKEDELIVGNPNLNSVACGIVLPVYATEEELEKARLHALDQNSVWGHHPPKWNEVLDRGLAAIKDDINRAIGREYLKTEPLEETLNEYRAMIISLNAVIRFAHRHAEVALRESQMENEHDRKQPNECFRSLRHPARGNGGGDRVLQKRGEDRHREGRLRPSDGGGGPRYKHHGLPR